MSLHGDDYFLPLSERTPSRPQDRTMPTGGECGRHTEQTPQRSRGLGETGWLAVYSVDMSKRQNNENDFLKII